MSAARERLGNWTRDGHWMIWNEPDDGSEFWALNPDCRLRLRVGHRVIRGGVDDGRSELVVQVYDNLGGGGEGDRWSPEFVFTGDDLGCLAGIVMQAVDSEFADRKPDLGGQA